MVKEIADKVNSMNLSGPDQVDVIMLALKQLNVIDQIRFLQKANKKRLHISDQQTATNCLGVIAPAQHSVNKYKSNC